MNAWLVAATALLAGELLLVLACFRGHPVDSLVAMEATGVVSALALLLLAEGFHRSSFADLALVLALLAYVGSLTFVRFMERWV
jgi:multisubunit Na+/H+ antiporter MnhF subunit